MNKSYRPKAGTPILPREYKIGSPTRNLGFDILSTYQYKQLNIDGEKVYVRKEGSGGGDFCRRDGMPYFKQLKAQYPELKQYTNGEIRRHIIAYNKCIADTICTHRDGVELPEHMGTVFVGALKSKNPPIDWTATEKTGKIIYQNSLKSMGYSFIIFYVHSLEKYNFANRGIWKITCTETVTSKVGAAFNKNWKNFISIPSRQHVEGFIKNYWNKYRANKKHKEELKSYNEFEGLI